MLFLFLYDRMNKETFLYFLLSYTSHIVVVTDFCEFYNPILDRYFILFWEYYECNENGE